jgi:hypothetical protein
VSKKTKGAQRRGAFCIHSFSTIKKEENKPKKADNGENKQ